MALKLTPGDAMSRRRAHAAARVQRVYGAPQTFYAPCVYDLGNGSTYRLYRITPTITVLQSMQASGAFLVFEGAHRIDDSKWRRA